MSESPERLRWPMFCNIHFSSQKFLHDIFHGSGIAVKSNIYMHTKMQNSTKKISETKQQVKFTVSVRCQICKGLFGLLCQKWFANIFIPKRFILLEKKVWGEITPPDLTISLCLPNF